MVFPSAVTSDPRLDSECLQILGFVFWRLRIPLKFKVVDNVVKLGWYTGTEMRKIFQNARTIFACSPFSSYQSTLWEQFWSHLELITNPPTGGQTKGDVSAKFKKCFGEWKEKFFEPGGAVLSEWRIYFHLLEMHAGDFYDKFGNLNPWANEAGENVHALDRTLYFQTQRSGIRKLSTRVLVRGMRYRWSHYVHNRYQTPSDIPVHIKNEKVLLSRVPKTLFFVFVI